LPPGLTGDSSGGAPASRRLPGETSELLGFSEVRSSALGDRFACRIFRPGRYIRETMNSGPPHRINACSLTIRISGDRGNPENVKPGAVCGVAWKYASREGGTAPDHCPDPNYTRYHSGPGHAHRLRPGLPCPRPGAQLCHLASSEKEPPDTTSHQ